tara:strand:+ start:6019 stop:6621 length:603 start_codon:yes stop_codon:yes gene_type:complete
LVGPQLAEARDNPVQLFRQWFTEAEKSEPQDHNAMTLATADKNGIPSARIVLLKDVDERGFVFFTNLRSRKGCELRENPYAALILHWKTLKRQVRIEGVVKPVTIREADDYFQSRPRQSQLGAWASKQSEPLRDQLELARRVSKYSAKYSTEQIPRPEFWSGLRLFPNKIEFWKEENFRLHDRTLYTRDGQEWSKNKLFP